MEECFLKKHCKKAILYHISSNCHLAYIICLKNNKYVYRKGQKGSEVTLQIHKFNSK